MPEYKCLICEKVSTQSDHHKRHIKSNGHKQSKEISKLKLEKLSEEELYTKYKKIDIELILYELETMK